MSLPLKEIPLGAIRFNSDSQKLEYWSGDAWFQIKTFSPTLDGGARGVWSGGDPSRSTNMDYITIPTRGDTIDFGDLPFNRGGMNIGIQASKTRGFICGGEAPVGDSNNYITRFEFSSTGSAVDHADLTFTSKNGAGMSSATRAIQHRGYGAPSITHKDVDFFTMASTANAVDFGDIVSSAQYGGGGMASPTRGTTFISYSTSNTIEFCTIATTGSFQDFGDATTTKNAVRSGTGGSSTRGVSMGGGGDYITTCSYLTFATTGNTTDFGELTTGKSYSTAVSDSITCMMAGGQLAPGGSVTNQIDSLSIATGGTAVDSGDLTVTKRENSAASNGHGGLG
tara:strand:- start:1728 stop:2744 length:1017 start_codon:yes stop_codon:yes gene_type:complete